MPLLAAAFVMMKQELLEASSAAIRYMLWIVDDECPSAEPSFFNGGTALVIFLTHSIPN